MLGDNDQKVQLDKIRSDLNKILSDPDPELSSARKTVIAIATICLDAGGGLLERLASEADDDRSSSSSPHGSNENAVRAVGMLARIAAELIYVSGGLLSGSQYYAGAALLRQVVEIEHLTWAFVNKKRDAAAWLNSTYKERRKYFSPSRLRKISEGRFNADDYRHHCELGGHPVPQSHILLGGSNRQSAQMLLVDLLLHCWRITDNLALWCQESSSIPTDALDFFRVAKLEFLKWSEKDPLYSWILTAPPAPKPGP